MQAQRLIPLVLFLALFVAVSRTAVNTTQAAANVSRQVALAGNARAVATGGQIAYVGTDAE